MTYPLVRLIGSLVNSIFYGYLAPILGCHMFAGFKVVNYGSCALLAGINNVSFT